MELYNCDILEGLKKIDDNSINLVFTSPPYWKGFEYESYFNSYYEYIKWCELWIKEIHNKLDDTGYFLLNIANDSETTIKAYELLNICLKYYKLCDTIIWFVSNRQPFNTNRQLTNQTEFIFLLRKNNNNINIHKERVKDEYKEVFSGLNIVGNIWRIPFKRKSNKQTKLKKVSKGATGHAGFPPILCEMIIKLFTDENDKVLDCFMGLGELANNCKKLNRYFIGIEKDKDIFDSLIID